MPPSSAAISTAELEALYRARLDSALTRFTEADVRFMTGMISHHAQALEMAGLAPTRGASPSIQILTARTINAQQDEITVMGAVAPGSGAARSRDLYRGSQFDGTAAR